MGSVRRDGCGPALPTLGLTVIDARWQGLGQGWGHLRNRLVTIEVAGRRAADRSRRVDLLLPGPTGAPAAAPDRSSISARGVSGDSVSGDSVVAEALSGEVLSGEVLSGEAGAVAEVVPLRRTG